MVRIQAAQPTHRMACLLQRSARLAARVVPVASHAAPELPTTTLGAFDRDVKEQSRRFRRTVRPCAGRGVWGGPRAGDTRQVLFAAAPAAPLGCLPARARGRPRRGGLAAPPPGRAPPHARALPAPTRASAARQSPAPRPSSARPDHSPGRCSAWTTGSGTAARTATRATYSQCSREHRRGVGCALCTPAAAPRRARGQGAQRAGQGARRAAPASRPPPPPATAHYPMQ
jgi:hypothetical protein